MAERKLNKDEFEEWEAMRKAANLEPNNRKEEVAKVNEKIEKELSLIGTTAIEDKL